jgi:UDP-3-O-[3-hydroxymyristoyl] glucosamine N-acyltransferase
VKLKKIAEIVSGKLQGNGEVDIRSVGPLDDPSPADLAFILEERYSSGAASSKARAFIAPAGITIPGRPVINVANPRLAMAQLLSHFSPKTPLFKGIHKSAVIAESARIGKRVAIHPFVYVGENCEIGDDSVIYPSVTLYAGVTLGKRVIVHAGARIGVDGYGYVFDEGQHKKIPQIGGVRIEDDVEIYANVTIARGTLGETRIGKGTKVDCLTHIAHNCNIGEHCAIVSLVGFAGSVTLKDKVYVGGQAGFNGHITVGENTVVMARAGVTKDIPANSIISGFPAQDHSKEMKHQANLRRLSKKSEK